VTHNTTVTAKLDVVLELNTQFTSSCQFAG